MVAPTQAKARFLSTTPRRLDRSFTNILADDNPPAVQVASIGQEGIQLVDGLKIPGPCVFLEGRVFLWDAPKVGEGKEAWKEWKEEHFELFDTVVPAPGKLHGILGICYHTLPLPRDPTLWNWQENSATPTVPP